MEKFMERSVNTKKVLRTVRWGLIIIGLFVGYGIAGTEKANLHQDFNEILQQYVVGDKFDYDALYQNKQDLQKLYNYVDLLERQNPDSWSENEALAYWINLYNAATIELVLKNYPVKSIKDIGFLFSSPWKRKVVKVNGKELSLDDIEHKIIRKKFKDARIHFALNCASLGCPPISNTAFTPAELDKQLDAACKRAIRSSKWVKITDNEIWVTKVFDWYKDDFVAYAGSVREFIARYRPEDRDKIMDENRELKIMDYDWSLNKVAKQ
jgi:hypothetical protein